MARSHVDTRDVIARLHAEEKKAKGENVTGSISYGTHYGVYVHERLDVYHKPPTQAKFLSDPATQLANDGSSFRTIKKVYKITKSLAKAVLVALLAVFNRSQKLVPVDTGLLRSTGQVKIDKKGKK